MSFIAIIPARFASTRLPGKALADIAGKSLIQRVYERTVLSDAKQVIVATDDERIEAAAKAFGADVCMTSNSHRSGTERLKEVVDVRGFAGDEIIVNVQGDEPLLAFENINQVAGMLHEQTSIPVATLCTPILDSEEVFNPNVVKVVKDNSNRAIYFSRAPIPWDQKSFTPIVYQPAGSNPVATSVSLSCPYYRHIGIYAYRASFIETYLAWPPSVLETTESLEQLRILENSVGILVNEALRDPGLGVDTEQDLQKVRTMLEQHASD